MQTTTPNALPWYREPWPWLLMAGPAVVVVAGFATLWLAVSSNDGLVADDYYKRGLAINRTLDRDAAAARDGYSASARFDFQGRKVELALTANAAVPLPETLTLRILHPTRAGQDQLVLLRRSTAGDYAGVTGMSPEGRRLLQLEDTEGRWRISGAAVFPSSQAVAMKSTAAR